MANFVLDSYAVLALLTDDVGADQVAELLSQSEHVFWMSVVNLGEVYYIVSRAQSQEDAESVVSDILHQDNVTIIAHPMRTSLWAATTSIGRRVRPRARKRSARARK